ncbi:MAG: biopolymer transporter ExbD [Desulfobacteraceae bacterium]|nr:MAG: biopolymer transporter ExbD [Desulfobacteraceae bacterium]
MRFKKVKDEEPRLGITPLIDIVFLLLIFFMVTSHFNVASGVSIKLPKVTQKVFNKDGERITLIIDKEGRTYHKGEKIDLKTLSVELKALVEKEGLVHLLLEADKDVTHGKVVQVMDLAKTAGVLSIIIAANWEPKKVF